MSTKNNIKKKTTSRRGSQTRVDWEKLTYPEMVAAVEKLSGSKPSLPKDLPQGNWSEQARRVLAERYLIKDNEGQAAETLEELCWRVAWEIARSEVKFGKTRSEVIAWAKTYYQLMISREFLPNSPTLMNAGKGNGLQYSACYVLPVEDSLPGIFDGIKYQALVHQSGGGTGFSFSRLRPAGSRVKSTMGVASGPVSFMRIYNEATQQIKQGGMRRGANMGILRVDHPDILEFIRCKDDGGITNFNVSVAITDKFMEALLNDTDYDLVAPHNQEVVSQLPAREVWDAIAQGAHKTGDPGIIFVDRINKSAANPIRKPGWEVESTNPCGEQPLYPFDACNLGSIFLKYFVTDGQVDWEKLKKTIHDAVRFLDSVIEMNPFPLPQIAEMARNIRRIGLGVGGWADMLVKLEIPYNSDEALHLAQRIMRFVNEEGHRASENLARERGAFPLWRDSLYKKGKKIRNSTVTTIAPTGSIGILANASGGVEPKFAIAYQHVVKTEKRTLNFVDELFEDVARQKGFWSEELMQKVADQGTVAGIEEIPEAVKRVFVTAHEIIPEWHVKTQAAFQMHTDNAVSKTINLSHDATVDDIKDAYMLAWETGCRGITVFRDGCKGEQVLNLGVKKETSQLEAEEKKIEDAGQPVIERPFVVSGATYRMQTPVGVAFITINHDVNKDPLELFINVGKAGSDVAAMAEALGRTISTALRLRGHLSPKEKATEIAHQLAGIGGRRSVGFGPNRVLSLPDAVATAISMHFSLREDKSENQHSHTNGHSLVTNGNGAPSGVTDTVQVADVSAEAETPAKESSELIDPLMVLAAPEVAPKLQTDLCPSCGEASLIFEEGCKKCYSCGHSEC